MKRITVNTARSYDVLLGGEYENAARLISENCPFKKAMIVTDSTVRELYCEKLVNGIREQGAEAAVFCVEPGDGSKNAANLASLWESLAENEFSGGDLIISLGGGVPGDLAGFAAATFLRGMRVVHIPTTLLAMVDSSVGGKTAINLSRGKNLAGAFHQPSLVLAFPELLSTLPRAVFNDGMAEVIKYSMIDGGKTASLLDAESFDIEKIIAACIEAKRDIVERDERDGGERRLLNFGHTAGHAAEALSGFSLSHGSAVAAGMAVITRAAVRNGMCEASCAAFLEAQLKKYSLPLSFSLDAGAVCERTVDDKKRNGGVISAVVPVMPGRAQIKNMKTDELARFIKSGWSE